jgi:hypothetical protein
MTEPEALQHRRHRLERRANPRAHGWQKIAYKKQAYDGSEGAGDQDRSQQAEVKDEH